ncbi:MAG: hypothetical protein P8Z37_19265 [Acidobacteriota bacterium]
MIANAFTEKLNEFWSVVVDVWNQGLWGVDVGRILVAFVVFLLFLVLRQLMARFIINRLKRLAKKTTFQFDDEIVEALQ